MRRLVVVGSFLFVSRRQAAKWNQLRHRYHIQDVIIKLQNDNTTLQHATRMVSMAVYPYRHVFVLPDYEINSMDLVLNESGVLSWRDISFQDVAFGVLQYAYLHEIQLDELARMFVHEKRWNHVESMTRLTMELAKAHHIDIHEAYIAGLFHDCTKNWREQADCWMRFVAPEHIHEAKEIYHQYTGAAFMKRVLHMRNDKAIYAVRHHVKGDGKSSLAQCLYIADKLDPSRGYDSRDTIDLCMHDLKKGYHVVKGQQEAYLRKTGVIG